ncbi:hypothetical protein [Burkholderia territorii]|uniref:hypothetical protein n=1 Tax=Burkholderia territorii TaxID=1503055 RepID=UPI0018C5AA20|nr:hypothetical protein [Burkholderia territorii]
MQHQAALAILNPALRIENQRFGRRRRTGRHAVSEHDGPQNETRAENVTHIETQAHGRILPVEKQAHTIAPRGLFRQINRTKKQSPVNTGLAFRSVPHGT